MTKGSLMQGYFFFHIDINAITAISNVQTIVIVLGWTIFPLIIRRVYMPIFVN